MRIDHVRMDLSSDPAQNQAIMDLIAGPPNTEAMTFKAIYPYC